ncbi:MAG: hypothetical protein HYX94_03050 [Chloroflexi bacterium]|nr:hypothetical protein [Chloroflexota bacterium]
MNTGDFDYYRYLIDRRQRSGKLPLLLTLMIVVTPFIVFVVGSGWLVSPLFKSVGFFHNVGVKADTVSKAATLDWAIPSGRFYTQANGKTPGTSQQGFKVSDDDGIMFWRDFDWLGGVDVVGFPASRRFEWEGATTQVFTRLVLQWDPNTKQTTVVNLLDVLSQQGKDDWLLQVHSIPKPLPPDFDKGKSWDKIVEGRQNLLTKNTSFLNKYFSVSDPMRLFGLPTSEIADMDSHFAMRTQRAVIQQWKQDTPWADAFHMTLGNTGDIAIQAGIFPLEALQPEDAPNSP